MKRIILPLALLLSSATMAQSDSTTSNYKFGVALNATYSGNYRFSPLSVLFTISKNRHQVDLGPQFVLTGMRYYDRSIGMDLYYRYYFKDVDKNFNTFLYVNFNYFNMMFDKNYTSVNSYHLNYSSHSFTTNLGYGMRYNFSNKFYLSANIGLGYRLLHSRHNFTYDDPQYNSSGSQNLNSPNLHGTVTIGYRF